MNIPANNTASRVIQITKATATFYIKKRRREKKYVCILISTVIKKSNNIISGF